MSVTSYAQAQFLTDGSIINNFEMHSIQNDTFDVYQTNNQGKHVLIDFSATWCTACWFYHNTDVLEDYYTKHGPNGTASQDAQVIFYEGDPSTNAADLDGTGLNTVGDWLLGVSHPICNESNPALVTNELLQNPSPIPFPTVALICADHSFYRISTGITDVNDLRTLVQTHCGLTPTATPDYIAAQYAYSIYPNPSSNMPHIKLTLDERQEVKIEIRNSLGQLLSKQGLLLDLGTHELMPSESDLIQGLYLLSLEISGDRSSEIIHIY